MYVCTNVCVYECVCVYASNFVGFSVDMYVNMCAYTCTFRVHVCVPVRNVNMCTCLCVCVLRPSLLQSVLQCALLYVLPCRM